MGLLAPDIKALVAPVKIPGQAGYKLALWLPQSEKAPLSPCPAYSLHEMPGIPAGDASDKKRQGQADMTDLIQHFVHGTGLPLLILACGAVVVITEAARASRRALWGDMFTEDFED